MLNGVAARANQSLCFAQIYELTRVRMSARYRGTLAGVLWVAISPISLFLVQAVVFGHFLSRGIPDYPLYLLSGLFPWFFITQSIDMGTGLFSQHGQLLKSFHIHPLVIFGSLIVDNFINFLITMALMAFSYLIFQGHWHFYVLFLFIPSLILAVWVLSVTWILGIMNVFLRDTKFVVSFAMQVLFFLTPIFYLQGSTLPPLNWINRGNPLTVLIAPFRAILFGDPLAHCGATVVKAGFLALATAGIAAFIWRRTKNDVYFRL